MKKSLVALAVLAATGAFAQSSVTLYGIVEATADIGYNRTQNSTTTTVNNTPAATPTVTSTTVTTSSSQKNNFRIQDGSDQGTGSSRVGFRGTEDLGGGMKANFLLEMGLNVDDGSTAAGAGFARNAWGGLSGGFGEVRLGRQVLGSYGVQANSWSAGGSSGLYDAGLSTAPRMGGVRFSNAIRYLSPNFGGFKASVMLAAPETDGDTSTTSSVSPSPTSASRRTGVDLALEYANGPAYIGFGYNKRDAANVTSSTSGVITTNVSPGVVTGYTVGGSYDLGVVKPFINYTRQTTGVSGSTVAPAGTASATNSSDANARALSIGLRAPVGAFTVIAGYGRSTTTMNGMATATNAGGVTATAASRGEEKRDAFQLGTQYALSKRTLIEANYGYFKSRSNGETSVANGTFTGSGSALTPGAGNSATRSSNANDRISSINVGLKHSF